MTLNEDGANIAMSPLEIARMAEHFFGYGRWEAPYWFVGPQAGMAQTGDNLALRYESWKALDFHAVVDCAAHSRGFGFTKWHRPHPPTQPTWRKLIRLLLSYKGLPNDTEAIREYQRNHWGSSTGETCVIELSGLAAPNLQIPQDTPFLHQRIAHIREKAQTHSPKFIVMYGIGQRREFEQITDCPFQTNGDFLICRMGTTVVALAKHPVTHGQGNDYWTTLGCLLCKLSEE